MNKKLEPMKWYELKIIFSPGREIVLNDDTLIYQLGEIFGLSNLIEKVDIKKLKEDE